MPETTTTRTSENDELRAVTAHAARILTAPLRRKAALTYLSQRGIQSTALPEDWPLGYAPPGWTRLTDKLIADGFTEQALLEAGLARRSTRGTLIDVFRDRIMFPINDHNGTVVGFIGRDLSGAPVAPKYLNTRETTIFSKGALLYGLSEGVAITGAGRQPVLVEGPLDVLAITARSRADGENHLIPVASSGTAVSPQQASRIATLVADSRAAVVIAMDGDSAGRSAAMLAGEQLRRACLEPRVAILPNGTDPAEYLTSPANSLRVFGAESALPLLTVQVQTEIARQGHRMQWIEGRLAAARGIAILLAEHPPTYATAQVHWVADVLLLAPTSVLTTLGQAFRDSGRMPPHAPAPATCSAPRRRLVRINTRSEQQPPTLGDEPRLNIAL